MARIIAAEGRVSSAAASASPTYFEAPTVSAVVGPMVAPAATAPYITVLDKMNSNVMEGVAQ